MPRFTRAAQASENIAFVSQSGALCTAILDWAQNNDVGFSSIVSMGSSIDVDFARASIILLRTRARKAS